MIDVKNAQLFMDLTEGNYTETKNPLGTCFDLAGIFVPPSPEKLASSRFCHSWGNDDEAAFHDKLGIWVIPGNKLMAFQIAKGSLPITPQSFSSMDGADADYAMFFQIPDEMLGGINVEINVTLVCMN